MLPAPGVFRLGQKGRRLVKEKSKMIEKRKIVLIVLAIVAMVAAGATLTTTMGTARAQTSGANPDTKQKEKNLTAGEVEARRLLLLMDRDQSGKVSRQEFMRFMEEEFQRLDINKDGELDVKELTQSRLVPHSGVHR
jgi:hypothetical protein